MCRSIKTLRPPVLPEEATEAEMRAAALQYVRKVSGFRAPAAHNREVFDRAVDVIADATAELLAGLEVRGQAAVVAHVAAHELGAAAYAIKAARAAAPEGRGRERRATRVPVAARPAPGGDSRARTRRPAVAERHLLVGVPLLRARRGDGTAQQAHQCSVSRTGERTLPIAKGEKVRTPSNGHELIRHDPVLKDTYELRGRTGGVAHQ
jgi:hypothetical protein